MIRKICDEKYGVHSVSIDIPRWYVKIYYINHIRIYIIIYGGGSNMSYSSPIIYAISIHDDLLHRCNGGAWNSGGCS